MTGPMRLSFSSGVSHYDAPPPAHITADELNALRDVDAFRFANVLRVWAEFDGDRVVAHGRDGGVVMGNTTVRVGPLDATFAAVPMPDLTYEPQLGDGLVSYTQTVGGRTALPLPRAINKAPYVRLQAPLVWSTLRLTVYADGRSVHELLGASPFPRHWVYDHAGDLALKAGVADWRNWLGQLSWAATPWGAEDSPVVVAQAESALERELSTLLMHGAQKPKIRTLAAGEVLAGQGSPGAALFLVLDGVLDVQVDGASLGDLGPGAVVGERAILENSPRTATLIARTPLRVAEAPADAVDRAALVELAKGHRRELASS
ncbi:MAG TPA: cyclic nucleotide-binding domain-containing protein [Jatrophihabitans sp.]|nr:cyclic nucleotide-binding domain-containing protein [Jatrophihabitans sp.]